MSKPHNRIFDGRGRLTEKDQRGSVHYRENVKNEGKTSKTIDKRRLWSGVGYLSLCKSDDTMFPIKHIPANTSKGVPEYDLVEVRGVKVHLRDGVKPDVDGLIKGRIEINLRNVTPKDTEGHPADKQAHHLAINIFPSEDEPVACVAPRQIKSGKQLVCADHWGPDYNRSHVFVLPLSQGLKPYAKSTGFENGRSSTLIVRLFFDWSDVVQTPADEECLSAQDYIDYFADDGNSIAVWGDEIESKIPSSAHITDVDKAFFCNEVNLGNNPNDDAIILQDMIKLAESMRDKASKLNATITETFLGVPLVSNPGDRLSTILAPFWNEMRRRYNII